MTASPTEITGLRTYINASRELNSWISGARVFALLSGALEAGVLDALRNRVTAQEISTATGLEVQAAADLCHALEEHGIARRDRDSYQLAPDYALLASPTAAVPLTKLLRQARVMVHELQQVAPAGTTYTTLSPEDVLAMAEGAGISALSSSPRVGQTTICQAMPEVEKAWRSGAHHLEVGCGVGNSLFGTLLSFPKVTAVGIEINELTFAETERRAHQLKLADRVTLRRMDACDLQDREAFDTIQWSQFFFPVASREPVLKAMHRALKPGGYLFMPWLGSVSEDTLPSRGEMARMAVRALRSGGLALLPYLNDLLGDTPARRKQERRFSALQRLLFRRWGVPVRSVGELQAEVTKSGFKVLRVMRVPASQFALTRGMLLARRDVV